MLLAAATRFSRVRAAATRAYSVVATDLRVGNIVSGSSLPGQAKDDLFSVTDFSRGKAGKGGGFVQVKFRQFPGQGSVSHKFWSDDRVEVIELDPIQIFMYLYRDQDVLHLMKMETGDQIELPVDIVGEDKAVWLQDGMELKVQHYQGMPLQVRLPDHVTLEVTEAPAKTSETHKMVTLETGERVRAPNHVEAGQAITLSIQDRSYVGKS
jgi:elongation factor P